MRRWRALPVALAACALAAGCGGADGGADGEGDAAGAAPGTAAPADTRVTLPAEPAAAPPTPTFPASSALDVVALAGLRPSARVRYDVTTEAGRFALEVAQDGRRGRLHRQADDGETWVGVDVGGRSVTWVCEAASGEPPACRADDPDGVGARTLAEVGALLGNDAVRRTYSPAASLPGTGVGPDVQAGVPVSCLAVTAEGRDLRLCASAEGIITQATAGTATARATAVSPDVQDADLEPPATPR